MLAAIKVKRVSFLFLATALFALLSPLPARSENVGPFGFGVGTDTFTAIKSDLDNYRCDYDDLSAITLGKLAICPSQNFNFDGLTGSVTLVFDEDEKLSAISMNILKSRDLNNSRFDIILKSLTSKYKLVRKNKPFVGDTSAILKKGDVNISFEAPHMSFEMSLVYSTDTFDKKLKTYNNNRQQERNAIQRNQL